MPLDPRTPVLVGAGTASQRLDDPASAHEACGLMVDAAEEAADDAGVRSLLTEIDLVLVPRGTWPYRDAGRLVASAVGAPNARSILADLGVLQTTLFERAATAIAVGAADVALVVGGEAKWRDLRASITGVPASATNDEGTPDDVLAPSGSIISGAEIESGLVTAVSHYALIEHARRAADGQSPDDHADAVARLWAEFNVVARTNPQAWNGRPMSAEEIRTPGPHNRTLATPYNKWHNSQWNVDQAGALLLCSVEVARARGVPTDRWVFPHAIAWSDHMVPVSERALLHRSPGFRLAGAAALGAARIGIDEVAHVDLYSCFPVAVRTQALELGLGSDRALTVTGGMTFAGGPLNNYVLQSTASMVPILRGDPGSAGLVSAISGMITKQAVSVWSCRPPEGGFRAVDVTADASAETPVAKVVAAGSGPATVATYTVLHDGAGTPERAVVVATTGDGSRTVVSATSPAAAMATGEWCGRPVELDGAGSFTI